MREYCGAAYGVAAALNGTATHQVNPATELFLKVFLQRAHFKKPYVAAGQKLHQQIHVATWLSLIACHGTEQIHPGNAATFASGSHNGPDFIQRRR